MCIRDRYIFTERNGIYIIDLQKTVKKLDEAYNFVRDIAAEGGDILFVGTKKQAQESVRDVYKRQGTCSIESVYSAEKREGRSGSMASRAGQDRYCYVKPGSGWLGGNPCLLYTSLDKTA